jgi:hypothetical protein
MSKSYASMEREHWLQTRTRGRSRFIWRQVLSTLLLGLIVVLGVEALRVRPHPFSLRSTILTSLLMLPIFLLGGYLTGRWKWQDLEKKYSRDNLPPRE